MLLPPAALEALLFTSGEPMEKKRVATLLGISDVELRTALSALTASLIGHGISLIESENEVELRTCADASDIVKKLRESEFSKDLGRAGLETLSIILYRGKATRSEVDWIRGVNSGAILRSLMLRGLIERTDDPTDARKILYKATTDALAHLGVENVSLLPRYEELSRGVRDAGEIPATNEPEHAPE